MSSNWMSSTIAATLIWFLLRQTVAAVGYPNIGVEPETEDSLRVTEVGNAQRETVRLSGGVLTVETTDNFHAPGQLYIHRLTNGHELLVLVYRGRGNLVGCERSGEDSPMLTQFLERYFNGSMTAFRKTAHRSGWLKKPAREAKFGIQMDAEVKKPLADWQLSMKACARLQNSKRKEIQLRQKIIDAEQEASTEDVVDKDQVQSRSRRAISIMLPGTTWCGVGNVSRDNDEAEGTYVQTDKCCRQHDLCAFTIEGFSRKYHMFNFRFHTISHCECDDRFRTCLRMANHPNSDMVGRLFFNILGMKCFIFKPETVCLERSWWGRCIRQGREPHAHLSESVPYYEN